MTEKVYQLDIQGDKIASVDWSDEYSYLAITNLGFIISPTTRFAISKSFQFPIIRIVDDHSFLIADSRAEGTNDNCFIFNSNGIQLSQFFAGDGIEDIVVVNNKIVITYFDEGVFRGQGPNNHGLVSFDLSGHIILKWNGENNDSIISDCYCVCQKGSNSILFFPYVDFPLIELNIDTFEKIKRSVPTNLHGSSSITAGSDSVFFHGPYDDRRGIYKWHPLTNLAERIGSYSEGIRGINNGKFLSQGDQGFTIINPE